MAYVKNTWATGDKITAAKMNHLEDGVAGAEGAVVSVNGQTGAVVLNANDVGAASVSALAHTNDALDAIFKLTRGQAWDIVQNNTTDYQKTIPSGTHLSVLNGWGGKSIVWNQLIHDGKVNSLTNWTVVPSYATLTLESNAIVYKRTTETASSRSLRPVTAPDVVIGHKYYISFDYWVESGTEVASVYMAGKWYSNQPVPPTLTADSAWHTKADLVTVTSAVSGNRACEFWDWMDTGKTAKCKNIQIIDLTQMFGAGNEPTTVEHFRAMFPADYYPYNAGETMHGDVTSIVLKDSDQTTVKTLTVPAAVRALTGYGQTGSAITYNAGNKTWAYTYNGTTTDITDLMADFDNYLNEVEPGGTLTFVNSNGADYGIPVPSQIDHYRNLSEVTL